MKTNGLLVLACCLLATPFTASADIYRWVNDRGVVSFTDSLGNIPERYRKKAVIIDALVPPVQEVIVGGGKETAGDNGKGAIKDGADEQKKKKLYGSKDEATWKRDSDRLNFEVMDTEKQITEMRDRLTDTSKMSRTEYLSLQNSIRLLEQRLQTQKTQRETFIDSAKKAGAPL